MTEPAHPVHPGVDTVVLEILRADKIAPGFARAVAHKLAMALGAPGSVLAALQPPTDAKNVDPRAMIG